MKRILMTGGYPLTQRPSALPAVCHLVTHDSAVDTTAAWIPPTPPAPVGVPAGVSAEGISGFTGRQAAGTGTPTTQKKRINGDVRGVPPRGRPV